MFLSAVTCARTWAPAKIGQLEMKECKMIATRNHGRTEMQAACHRDDGDEMRALGQEISTSREA